MYYAPINTRNAIAARNVFDSVSDATAFVMSAQTLAKALTTIKQPRIKSNIPNLHGVHLQGDESGLTLRTANYDQELAHTIPLAGLPSFSVCVNFAQLLQIAKAKGKATIIIDTAEGFSIDGMSLPSFDADDFMKPRTIDARAVISVNGNDFKPMLNAIYTEAARYYLNGLYVHGLSICGAPPVVTYAATDGHRLAKMQTGQAWPHQLATDEEDRGVIIPREFAAFIARQGEGELHIGRDHVAFVSGQTRGISGIIDGTFPDYGRVIPTQNHMAAMVDKAALQNALKLLKATDAKGARLTFEGQALTLSHAGQSVRLENVAHDDDFFEIGFNVSYLMDLCADYEGDTLSFAFNDAATPTLIEDAHRVFVLMPIRL